MYFYTNVDRYGNNILLRGYKDNKRITRKIKYQPTFFIPAKKDEGWKSLYGDLVSEFSPGSMRDCRDFLEQYKDVENFKIFGTSNYVHQFINSEFPHYIKYDRKQLRIFVIDIEVASENGFPHVEAAENEIIAITIKDNNGSTFHSWGLYDFDASKCKQSVLYRKCKNERDLLLDFIEYWCDNYPDIVTGWYSDFFDIPYLINRITKIFGEDMAKSMSPWRIINSNNVTVAGREQISYDIVGIQQLDYIDLFKKFTYNTLGQQESYKLGFIANVVLGEKKLDYSEYGTLHKLYINNFQKFLEYNIKDVELVDRLDEKLNIITLCLTLAYRSKCTIKETLGTVSMWEAILYSEFLKRKLIVPLKRVSSIYNSIKGGFVKEPINGKYEWVVSFDLNSLYPHLIMQYNMSPETIINEALSNITPENLLKIYPDNSTLNIRNNTCLTATGQLFRKDVNGVIPQIIEEYYNERSDLKRKMIECKKEYEKTKSTSLDIEISILNTIQTAIKIAMNAFYGALANKYFLFFDARVAEAITVSGQFSIMVAEKFFNKTINEILETENIDYVIAMDTDSCYLNMGPFVKKFFPNGADKTRIVDFLSKVSKTFEANLEEEFSKMAIFMNAKTQKMVMKREIIADVAIWTGKKHYIANVWDSEGVRYSEPELKIVGIEAVKSSTPAVCRDFIKDTLKELIKSDEKGVQKYIEKVEVEFKKCTPEDIAAPRGVSDIEKFTDHSSLYKKGTPMHVRASILYNNFLKTHGIDDKYEIIKSGGKLKYLYLKMPNPLKENIIGFADVMPKEFDILDYIDYDTQFEKTYLDPITAILTAIGWKPRHINTLEDFFSD